MKKAIVISASILIGFLYIPFVRWNIDLGELSGADRGFALFLGIICGGIAYFLYYIGSKYE